MATDYSCTPTGVIVFALVVVGCLYCVTLVTAIWTIRSFWLMTAKQKHTQKKQSKIANWLKYLCTIAEIVCCIGICPGTVLFLLIRLQCKYVQEIEFETGYGQFTRIMNLTPYSVNLTFLYIIFAYRVYFSFDSSMFSLSNRVKFILATLLVLHIILVVAASIGYLVDIDLGLRILAMQTIFGLIGSLYLLAVFIQKMKQVSYLLVQTQQNAQIQQKIDQKTEKALQQTEQKSENKTQLEQVSLESNSSNRAAMAAAAAASASASAMRDESSENYEFVETMAKLSVLILFSVFLSVIVIIASVLSSVMFPDASWANIVGLIVSAVDITVNAICLALHWPFAKFKYKKICAPCHKFMISKCANNANQYVLQMTQRSSNTSVV